MTVWDMHYASTLLFQITWTQAEKSETSLLFGSLQRGLEFMRESFRAALTAVCSMMLMASVPHSAGPTDVAAIGTQDAESTANLVSPAASGQAEVEKIPNPCNADVEDRTSELCAQWTATDAAVSAANATWLFGGLGALFAFVGLIAAWRAAEWAKNAVNTTISTERARIHIKDLHVRFTEETDGKIGLRVSWLITNYGQCPGVLKKVPLAVSPFEPGDEPEYGEADTDHAIFVPHGREFQNLMSRYYLLIDRKEVELFFAGKKQFYAWGKAEYVDTLSGKSHSSGFLYRIECQDGEHPVSRLMPRGSYWLTT